MNQDPQPVAEAIDAEPTEAYAVHMETDEVSSEAAALPAEGEAEEETATAMVVSTPERSETSETAEALPETTASDTPQAELATPEESLPELSSPTPETEDAASTTSSQRTPRSRRSSRPSTPDSASSSSGVAPQRAEAATDAHGMLEDTVPFLPVAVGDVNIRSFGNITDRPEYSTATALYPIGFSCDLFEFSPVHGRILKLRCSILDGRAISRQVLDYSHQGPIFRISWGDGVDTESESVEYPFDANGAAFDYKHMKPQPQMRVKVKFVEDFFYGTITAVEPKDGNPRSRQCDLHVTYDDGAKEIITYPDPDVQIAMPGKSPRRLNVLRCVISLCPRKGPSHCLIKKGI